MKSYLRSFAAGEISPRMLGRIDDGRYQTGLALARNFITLPHGPLTKRPGFEHVAKAVHTGRVELLDFVASDTDAYILEFGELPNPGAGYMRVLQNGAVVTSPSSANAFVPSFTYTNTALHGMSTTATPPYQIRVVEPSHSFEDGDKVAFTVLPTGVIPAGAGSTPDGLVQSRTYWVSVLDANTYGLREGGPNGPAVELASQWADIVTPVYASGGTRNRVYAVGDYLTSGPILYMCIFTHIAGASFNVVNFLPQDEKGLVVASPYAEADLVALNDRQSNDVLTIAHPSYPLHEVRRLQPTEWEVVPASFAAKVATPGSVGISRSNSNFIRIRSAGHTGQAEPRNSIRLEIRPDPKLAVGTEVFITNGQFAELNETSHVIVDVEALSGSPSIGAIYTIRTLHGRDVFTQKTVDWNISGNTVTCVAHGLRENGWFSFGNVPNLPPAGININQIYYAANVTADTFQISSTPLPTYTIQTWTPAATTTHFIVDENVYELALGTLPPDDQCAGQLLPVTTSSSLVHDYKVAAVSDDESISVPSVEVTITNNLNADSATNVITWAAVTGATRYNVYKKRNGVFGYIGQSETTSFTDDNIIPDLGITPPIFDSSLSGTDYPGAVGYFEQRKWFGGTVLFPQTLWGTRPGTEADLTFTLPPQADNRILVGLASTKLSRVRHILDLGEMVVLTNSNALRIGPAGEEVIQPDSISVRSQAYRGANGAPPVIVDRNAVFCSFRGGHVRDVVPQVGGGFLTRDLSLRAAHLFDGFTVTRFAYSEHPYPVVWSASSSGKLLGLSYVPDEEVIGWHQHTTGDDTTPDPIESCATNPEGSEDRLYVSVNRGGQRYIERMGPMLQPEAPGAIYVDRAVVLNSPPIGSNPVPAHLNGLEVDIIADGILLPKQTIAGSAVDLVAAHTTVVIGLPYKSKAITLPSAAQIEGFGQGRQRSFSKTWAKLVDSSPFQIGPNENQLSWSEPYFAGVFPQRQTLAEVAAAQASAITLTTDEIDIPVEPTWIDGGQVVIVHELPLPLTILGLSVRNAYGGE